MRLQNLASAVRDNARKYGVRAALHDLECRALNKVVRFEILKGMAARIEDVQDPALFEAPGFEGRFVGELELARYSRERLHELTPEFLGVARAKRDRCYALFADGELAAYGWYSALPTPIDEHFVLHFDASWTYMYKGYTVPAYRGKRLHAVGMCRALRAFAEEGKRGLVSYVSSNNFASLQSVTRMGYRVFGQVYLLRAGRHFFTHETRGCREYGFRVQALDSGEGWARQAV